MADINLAALMQQAEKLQEKVKEIQQAAAERTVEAQSGGGMVRAIVDGTLRVRRIEIDPKMLEAGDKQMLEDLIVVAVNDGLRRAQNLMAEEMSKLGPLGGFKLPGLGD